MIVRYVVHYNIEDVLLNKISEYRSDLIKNKILIDKENLPLHCTLYAFNSEDSNESEIIKKAHNIQTLTNHIMPKHLDVFSHNILVMRLERTQEIYNDHKAVINTFYPFVFHDINIPDEIQHYLFTKNQKESYSKYGSPFFGALYNPHISLGKLSEHNPSEPITHKNIFKHEEQPIKSFSLSRIENNTFKTLFSNVKS